MKMEDLSSQQNKYFAKLAARCAESNHLVIRPKGKKTRLFLDREYFEKGYAAKFPNSTTVVLCILAAYANAETQACFPSIKTIMKDGGLANRNYVIRDLRILEKTGIVEIEHSRGRRSNTYRLRDVRFWKDVDSINGDTIEAAKKQPP